METQSFCVKVPLAEGAALSPRDVIPVFHRWIQHDLLPGEIAIDVADYSHVHRGPGVLLVCHEAHYALDQQRGVVGLAYSRKRGASGTQAERWALALAKALGAARLLEREPSLAGRATFRTDRLELAITDRLRAPNDARTLAHVRDALDPILARLYGSFEVDHRPDPREPFHVDVRADGAPALDVVLGRLAR